MTEPGADAGYGRYRWSSSPDPGAVDRALTAGRAGDGAAEGPPLTLETWTDGFTSLTLEPTSPPRPYADGPYP